MAIGLDGPILTRPGGPLPVKATNYVRRDPDGALHDILLNHGSPSSLVLSAVHGGTSSFLNRVYGEAERLESHWPYFIDVNEAIDAAERFNQLELFRYFFQKIEMPDGMLVGRDVEEMKEEFAGWAVNAWKNMYRVVLIVDGVASALSRAGSPADVWSFVNWFLALRNEIARNVPPYDKLILFTGLAGRLWTAAQASYWPGGMLELKKFTPAQVAAVFDQIGVDRSRYDATEVFSLFHGHPYLTQLFAWSMQEGCTMLKAKEAALALQGAYGSHWERLKLDIRDRVGATYSVDSVLAAVYEIASRVHLYSRRGRPPRVRTISPDAIWDSYGRHLRLLGLADFLEGMDIKVPSICEFYRHAIIAI
jgi:hypothetical protein